MSDAPQLELSDDWRFWVVDNALDGVRPEVLIQTLVDGQVPEEIARAEVGSILGSSVLAVARQYRRAQQRSDSVLELLARHSRLAPQVRRIQRPPAEAFFADYYAASQPAIFTDVLSLWPRLWTPQLIRETLGEAEIEIMADRDRDPLCDRRHSRHRKRTSMACYIDQVMQAGHTNDIYMVAQNETVRLEAFKPLLEDIVMDETYFDPARLLGGSSFWLGPAGTRTPLHHDTANIMFCQVYGRKKVSLIPPWEKAVLPKLDGFYVNGTLESLDIKSARTVVLEPSEALFIPAGWIHQVEALEVSINFSFLNFRKPNRFSEFQPGHLR